MLLLHLTRLPVRRFWNLFKEKKWAELDNASFQKRALLHSKAGEAEFLVCVDAVRLRGKEGQVVVRVGEVEFDGRGKITQQRGNGLAGDVLEWGRAKSNKM